MKCLCGFKQKPDNVRILKAHLEDCLTNGYLMDMHPLPHVVWRGEFRVVQEMEIDEADIDLGLEIKRAPAGEQRIQKKLAAREAGKQAIIAALGEDADHETIVAAIENPVEFVVSVGQEEEEKPKPKPAPKKKAPAKTTSAQAKKKTSTTKKKL